MAKLKKIVFILFILVVLNLGTGFYLLNFQGNEFLGNRFIGGAVAVGAIILMPLFLYTRFKGKKLADYTLTPENIKKMKDKLQE